MPMPTSTTLNRNGSRLIDAPVRVLVTMRPIGGWAVFSMEHGL